MCFFIQLLKDYPQGSLLDASTIAAIARAKNAAYAKEK